MGMSHPDDLKTPPPSSDIRAMVERWKAEETEAKRHAGLDWLAPIVLILCLVAVFLVLPFYFFGVAFSYIVVGAAVAFFVFSLGYRLGGGRWPLE